MLGMMKEGEMGARTLIACGARRYADWVRCSSVDGRERVRLYGKVGGTPDAQASEVYACRMRVSADDAWRVDDRAQAAIFRVTMSGATGIRSDQEALHTQHVELQRKRRARQSLEAVQR